MAIWMGGDLDVILVGDLWVGFWVEFWAAIFG